MAAVGPCCCVWAFPSGNEWGLLFIAVRSLLLAVVSLVAEHGLQVHWLSSCGVWPQQLWYTGLVALQEVKSSQTRNQTPSPELVGMCYPLYHQGSLILFLLFSFSPKLLASFYTTAWYANTQAIVYIYALLIPNLSYIKQEQSHNQLINWNMGL